MLLNCFDCFANKNNGNHHQTKLIPIHLITTTNYPAWLATQPTTTQNWLAATQFRAEAGSVRLLPDAVGNISQVICCIAEQHNFWDVGNLPFVLPEGQYEFANTTEQQLTEQQFINFGIAWGLGAYQFTRYKTEKKNNRAAAQLHLPEKVATQINETVQSIYLVRDLINTPADDMGPTELAAAAKKLAQEFKAQFSEIVGEDLLKENYAGIYTVGRASDDAPRLVDIRWGNPTQRKVTLVGKGVCFDTGGLDLKPSSYMLLMKKDMGGAAHVLGLARMIMAAKLPVCLRVLIPIAENNIGGNAYRPGDVIKSRKGLTIEVGNTDAEGRVVVADALTEAVSEKPDLLIDITTLTGAARVALGTELPGFFANQNKLAQALIDAGEKTQDPVWRLPLFALYRDSINSQIADLNNSSSDSYGGAITAALFLKEFVPDTISWLHFDIMAWNLRARPGRPQGGEAVALRALFQLVREGEERGI